MSRKASSKKSKRTHKRKKHAIDHEWLNEAFYKDHLEKGKSIASIAKRYVRVKKTSTVGSISGVLYAIKKQHKTEQAEVADLLADKGGVVLTADPPYVVKGKTFEKPDYKFFSPPAKPYALPKDYKVKPDTPTLKSLQQTADFHLSQYKKALKEILEVIGGEQ